MTEQEKTEAIRERLLNEAEMLFSQNGYHAVSVREITAAAKCNLAAINYHFGNKENLYKEVFRSRWVPRARRVQQCFRDSLKAPISKASLIEALASAFLEGPLSDEERYCHHQLMAREIGRPTEAFQLVVEEVMRPFFRELAQKLAPLIEIQTGDERLMLDILCIFAMVLHFNFGRETISRIMERKYDSEFKNRLVKQITDFSIKGLGGDRKEKGR